MQYQVNLFSLVSFLAHGDSYRSLSNRYRIAPATVHKILKETCATIWDCLVDTELPEPTTEHWREIEKQFAERWNFPNCVGALDGKHVIP